MDYAALIHPTVVLRLAINIFAVLTSAQNNYLVFIINFVA